VVQGSSKNQNLKFPVSSPHLPEIFGISPNKGFVR